MPGGFDFVVRHMLVVVGCFTRATIKVLRYTVSWLKRFPNGGRLLAPKRRPKYMEIYRTFCFFA